MQTEEEKDEDWGTEAGDGRVPQHHAGEAADEHDQQEREQRWSIPGSRKGQSQALWQDQMQYSCGAEELYSVHGRIWYVNHFLKYSFCKLIRLFHFQTFFKMYFLWMNKAYSFLPGYKKTGDNTIWFF